MWRILRVGLGCEVRTMERIRMYIVVDSISYTFTLVIQSLIAVLSNDGRWVPLFGGMYLLQLFAVCSLISLLMYLTDPLLEDHMLWQRLVQLLEVFAAVFGVGGGLFGWFEWTPALVLSISVLLIVVYAATYGIMLLQNYLISREINEKLSTQLRKKKNPEN